MPDSDRNFSEHKEIYEELSVLRDRIKTLELEFVHMNKSMDGMQEKVDEMHEILLQAKGAKWTIFLLAAVGGFLATKISSLFALFGK